MVRTGLWIITVLIIASSPVLAQNAAGDDDKPAAADPAGSDTEKKSKMFSPWPVNARWMPAIEVDNEAFKEFRKKHGLSE